MRIPSFLLLVSLLLATLTGCVAPSADIKANAALLPDEGGRVVAHMAGGLVALPADLAGLAGLILDIGQEGGEPTVGVDSAGAMYVTGGGAQVLKSDDKGASWKDVSDRSKHRPDVDPYLWVDPTTDRIFSAPLNIVCTNLMWSDDGGSSWEWNPLAGCGLPGHDHQALVTGPPPEGVKTDGYPNVVYYTYNSFRPDGTRSVTSLDGGKTWKLDVKVADGDDCHSSLSGAATVAPDGTVYLPMARCDGLLVGVSKDAGATWTTVMIDGAGMLGGHPGSMTDDTPFTGNPAATVDSEGNAYMAWPGADGRVVMSTSRDGGSSWSEPVHVTPPDVLATVYVAAIASAPGHIAIGYFGTKADPSGWRMPSAQYAPADTRWDLYLTVTNDALAETPSLATLQVTPDDDPVQIGCVWLSGGVNDCRNLGDFFDITEQAGRPYLAYADGCDKCTKDTDSRRSDLRVLVLDTGPSLGTQGALLPYASEVLTPMASQGDSTRPRLADLTLLR